MTSAKSFRHRMLGPFAARPRLLAAIGAGGGAWALLLLVPSDLSLTTSAILAWDVTCAVYIVAAVAMMWRADEHRIGFRFAQARLVLHSHLFAGGGRAGGSFLHEMVFQ